MDSPENNEPKEHAAAVLTIIIAESITDAAYQNTYL